VVLESIRKGRQLRLYFSALAYTLMEALRRLPLNGTEWAQVDTIRRKLFKIDAIIRISVRRILLQMSSAYPWITYLRASLPCPALLNTSDVADNSTQLPPPPKHRRSGAMFKIAHRRAKNHRRSAPKPDPSLFLPINPHKTRRCS
jgi:hypothetical protein